MLKFVLEVLFLLCRALNMLRCVLLPAAPGLCMATSGAQASFFLVFSHFLLEAAPPWPLKYPRLMLSRAWEAADAVQSCRRHLTLQARDITLCVDSTCHAKLPKALQAVPT